MIECGVSSFGCSGDMVDIAVWLRELGLECYESAFRDNDIDAEVLPQLTADDLSALGITSIGHRRKILVAIASLSSARSVDKDKNLESKAAEPAGQIAGERSEAERRQLTVMFLDLVGSTELAVELDPEEMSEIIRSYQTSCSETVGHWGGHVAKFMGDGILAYFGWPRAHEDDAERAVRAGLDLVRVVAKLKTPVGDPLSVRVGIATGRVMVGDLIGEGAAQEEAVVGDTPNLAARLQGVAAPEQVLIAESTRRLLGDLFALSDLGSTMLKGFAEPIQMYSVSGEQVVGSRFEARSGPSLLPMVGRDQELALLLERWAQAEAGEGQGVLLVGEAGIGKSRISRALLDTLANDRHVRIRYQCSPYHPDSALWPVIQQLGHAAGFHSDDTTESRLDKLEKLIGRAEDDVERVAPFLAELLGIDYQARYGELDLAPPARRQRTLEVLIDQLLGLAARDPVLLILEDAHWVDPTTLELIEQSLDRIAARHVMILLTSRPDNQPDLAAHPHVTRLTLNRLSRGGAKSIIKRLGGEDLDEKIVDSIIARTDGVPLFVEELTKAILETGETSVPASLHDSLMARLDRLPEVKEIAQVAACIGREFGHILVSAIAGKEEQDLHAGLDKLADAQIIFRRGSPPNAQYSFKHALIRDAAYHSLLISSRRRYHRRIAEVIESRLPETYKAQPELVAHHYTEGGLLKPAIENWQRAGAQAIERSANLEAINQVGRALDLLESLPQTPERDSQELDLRLALGAASIAPKGYSSEEVRIAFQKAKELCQRVGGINQSFRAVKGLWNCHLLRGELRTASDLAEQLLALAKQSREPDRLLSAQRVLALTYLGLGDYKNSLEACEAGIELYDTDRQADYLRVYGEDPGLFCYVYATFTNYFLGHQAAASRRAEEALGLVRDLPSLYARSYVFALLSSFYLWQRRLDVALELARAAIDIAKEHSIVQWQSWAEIVLGNALSAKGQREEGLSYVLNGLETIQKMRALFVSTIMAGTIAEAYRNCGESKVGLKFLGDIESTLPKTDIGQLVSEIFRLRGHLLADSGASVVQIETAFEKAIDVARSQDAKMLEFKAAVDLARLWRTQSRNLEARKLLAPLYRCFPENSDTLDLDDARALLDELR